MKLRALACLACTLAFTVTHGEETLHPVDFNAAWEELSAMPRNERPAGWVENLAQGKFGNGSMRLVSEGDSYALEIRADENTEEKEFHIYSNGISIPTAPGAIVEVKVLARGSGSFRIAGYLYTEAGESVGAVWADPTMEPTLREDTFSEFSFWLVVPGARRSGSDPASLRLALAAASDSTLWVKSIRAATDFSP